MSIRNISLGVAAYLKTNTQVGRGGGYVSQYHHTGNIMHIAVLDGFLIPYRIFHIVTRMPGYRYIYFPSSKIRGKIQSFCYIIHH